MRRAIAAFAVAMVSAVCITSCISSCTKPAPTVVAAPVQYVDPTPVQPQQPVQVVQQPVYVQPQASTHDGLVEGMIIGHMMGGGGGYGGGYHRAPVIVNRTTIVNRSTTTTSRPSYRSSGRRR